MEKNGLLKKMNRSVLSVYSDSLGRIFILQLKHMGHANYVHMHKIIHFYTVFVKFEYFLTHQF